MENSLILYYIIFGTIANAINQSLYYNDYFTDSYIGEFE